METNEGIVVPVSGVGKLTAIIWPVYIGAGMVGTTPPITLNEPIGDPVYERGQIMWTPVSDWRQVIGRARIMCPPGEYNYFLYFMHPKESNIVGVMKMDHPVRFTDPINSLDVDPIVNSDLELNKVNT
jgi:hypothetical protein